MNLPKSDEIARVLSLGGSQTVPSRNAARLTDVRKDKLDVKLGKYASVMTPTELENNIDNRLAGVTQNIPDYYNDGDEVSFEDYKRLLDYLQDKRGSSHDYARKQILKNWDKYKLFGFKIMESTSYIGSIVQRFVITD
jgi:hypothetical protein